jgi:putative ATP-binding cassette transporter
MYFFYFLLNRSRWGVIGAVMAGVVSGAANIGLLALINAALSPDIHGVGSSLWLFGLLTLCALSTKIISELLLIRLGQQTTYNLRLQLWRQILAVPLRRHEELGRHRLLTALTDDVFTITNFVTFLPSLCMSLAIVLGSLVYLGWLSWVVLLMVIGFLIVGVTTYQLPVRKAQRYFALVRGGQDALFKQFRGLTEGIKELKLHGARRQHFSSRFEETVLLQRRYNTIAASIFIVAASWGQILFLILIGAIVLLLPAYGTFERRTLTGAALALLFMRAPLEAILGVLPNMGSASIAVRNVEELGLSLVQDSEKETQDTNSVVNEWQSLELVGVSHTYRVEREGHDFTLGPINLTIQPGDLIFVAGGNGSGKTTLAKILTGLYVPEGGEIRLDGESITDENREAYRQYFSAVFSDFHLFENLLGLAHSELDSLAQEYLVRLQLDHKVEVTNGELSTTELSQGQRKRLALLTAYLEDRPIYVFDEWAADQDPFYKEIFYYQLLPELKARGKTLFVITHDDRYYQLADYIIKLDAGQMRFMNAAQPILEQPVRL